MLSDRIVLVYLHEYFDKNSAPFHNEIAESLGISQRAVRRSISKLVEMEYIKRTLFVPDGYVQEVSKYRPGRRYHEIGKQEKTAVWFSELTESDFVDMGFYRLIKS